MLVRISPGGGRGAGGGLRVFILMINLLFPNLWNLTNKHTIQYT